MQIVNYIMLVKLCWIQCRLYYMSLQWRHNGCDGVSNHQRVDGLLNRLFTHRSKKRSKLHVTDFCEGISPVADEFPSLRASNAKNASIWWRHHGIVWYTGTAAYLYNAFQEQCTHYALLVVCCGMATVFPHTVLICYTQIPMKSLER